MLSPSGKTSLWTALIVYNCPTRTVSYSFIHSSGCIIIFKMHEHASISYYCVSYYCRVLEEGFLKELRIYLFFLVSVCIEQLCTQKSTGLFYCMFLAYLYYSNALIPSACSFQPQMCQYWFSPSALLYCCLLLVGPKLLVYWTRIYTRDISLIFLKSIHMYEQINWLYFSPWRKSSIYFICTCWE